MSEFFDTPRTIYTFCVEELHWLLDKISAPSEKERSRLSSSLVRSHSCEGTISTVRSGHIDIYMDFYNDFYTDIYTDIYLACYIDIDIDIYIDI